jgi:hypothetical protein
LKKSLGVRRNGAKKQPAQQAGTAEVLPFAQRLTGSMEPGRESVSIAFGNTKASKRIGIPIGDFLSAPSGKTIPLNNLQKIRGYAVWLTMPEPGRGWMCSHQGYFLALNLLF